MPPVALDGALVERARAAFAQISPASRVYGRIRGSAAAQAVPSWRPRNAMGPLGSALFTRRSGRSLDDGVPGLFTPAGYYGVFMTAMAPAIRDAAAESWVFGAKTDLAEDTAKQAALETEVD